MAGKVRWTPKAREDLLELYFAIGRENVNAAERWFDRIEQVTDLLARTPLLETARDGLRPGLRSFPVGNYLIFFAPISSGLEVVRIIDGRRNYPELFD